MTGEQQLKQFTEINYQKTITKVNQRIYHFLGYGHSNAIAIIGETSIILIDTLDSDVYAKAMYQELKKISDKPVRTIIYTHGHPDHRGGAGFYRDTVTEVIAHAPVKPVLKYYERINDVLLQRGIYQHGYGLSDEEAICQGIGIREGHTTENGKYDFLEPTTVYTEKSIERIIDGVKLKIVSAPGETDDQIYIYLEEDNVICTGDNYYGCWPNLYAIRGTQYRDIAIWLETLDEILSYHAEALLPGHTKPLLDKEQILYQVGTFKDAIEYTLLTTLDCINKGMSMSEAVAAIKLPKQYQTDFLGEFYGTIEWSIKAIYTGYLGWFDGNATHLLPISDKDYNQTLIALMDIDKLKMAINQCMEKEEYQKALQLIELLEYSDDSTKLQVIKKEALLHRAKQVTSANARHYLIAATKEI